VLHFITDRLQNVHRKTYNVVICERRCLLLVCIQCLWSLFSSNDRLKTNVTRRGESIGSEASCVDLCHGYTDVLPISGGGNCI